MSLPSPPSSRATLRTREALAVPAVALPSKVAILQKEAMLASPASIHRTPVRHVRASAHRHAALSTGFAPAQADLPATCIPRGNLHGVERPLRYIPSPVYMMCQVRWRYKAGGTRIRNNGIGGWQQQGLVGLGKVAIRTEASNARRRQSSSRYCHVG